MATSQIASMLDELMGRNRNAAPDEEIREMEWWDQDVCRFFLVQFCPHDLFVNTKADLGPCPKIHDEELKKKYTEESNESYKKNQYIDDFLRFCQRMLSELSTRIKKAKERLSLTQKANGTGNSKEALEKIELLSAKINDHVEKAEAAGNQGNVDEAQSLLRLCDNYRQERDYIRNCLNSPLSPNAPRETLEKIESVTEKIANCVRQAEESSARQEAEGVEEFLKLADGFRAERNSLKVALCGGPVIINGHPDYTQQTKAMEVCDVCGAFLIVGDAQQRIDDHLLGKQHVGYARLRAATEQILEGRRKYREDKDKELEERKKKREQERSGSRSVRNRSRSRDRNNRKRRSSRSRDRSRDRHRRRSRSPRKRSRDRRRRSSRSQERRHSRRSS